MSGVNADTVAKQAAKGKAFVVDDVEYVRDILATMHESMGFESSELKMVTRDWQLS
jgi:hypothetical protein